MFTVHALNPDTWIVEYFRVANMLPISTSSRSLSVNNHQGWIQHQSLTATYLLVNSPDGTDLKKDVHSCTTLRYRKPRSRYSHTK